VPQCSQDSSLRPGLVEVYVIADEISAHQKSERWSNHPIELSLYAVESVYIHFSCKYIANSILNFTINKFIMTDPEKKKQAENQPAQHEYASFRRIDQEIEDEAIDDDQDFDINDSDDSTKYGSSGEKYGWYNGYSDDAIDDAFEGDPENTWNVD